MSDHVSIGSNLDELREDLGNSSSATHAALLWTHDAPVSDTALNWQGTDYDTDSFVAGDGSGFVVPTSLGGAYLFTATLIFTWSAFPTYISVILDFSPEPVLWSPYSTVHPTSNTYTSNSKTSSGFGVSVSAMAQFSPGDHIKVIPEWSGGTGVALSAREISQFGLSYLGSLA